MNKLLALFFISSVVGYSNADRIGNVLKYVDEVLSVHVPWAIEVAGLTVYEMPNFSNNFQNRSHDGTATTGKIDYHSGNLTGLQSVHRKMCEEPVWTSSNLTSHCNIVFPQITGRYKAKMQLLSPLSNGVRFRMREFGARIDVTDMEAELVVTASPHVRVPTIKSLTIVNDGRPTFRFDEVPEVSSEILSSHFYHKYKEIFHHIFHDLYREAFERAVESIPYPI